MIAWVARSDPDCYEVATVPGGTLGAIYVRGAGGARAVGRFVLEVARGGGGGGG